MYYLNRLNFARCFDTWSIYKNQLPFYISRTENEEIYYQLQEYFSNLIPKDKSNKRNIRPLYRKLYTRVMIAK